MGTLLASASLAMLTGSSASPAAVAAEPSSFSGARVTPSPGCSMDMERVSPPVGTLLASASLAVLMGVLASLAAAVAAKSSVYGLSSVTRRKAPSPEPASVAGEPSTV